jgi:hypothetical protein
MRARWPRALNCVTATASIAALALLAACSSGSASSPLEPDPAGTAACSTALHQLYDTYSATGTTPPLTSAPPQCRGVSTADLNTIVDQIIASAFASAFPEGSATP